MVLSILPATTIAAALASHSRTNFEERLWTQECGRTDRALWGSGECAATIGTELLHSVEARPAEGTFSVSVSYLHFDLNTKFPTLAFHATCFIFSPSCPFFPCQVGNNKKIRKEGHSSHTSSKVESPFSGPQKNSQQGILTETTKDAPHAAPLHDDVILNHNAVNSPINSGNGKVNLQAPHIGSLRLSSFC